MCTLCNRRQFLGATALGGAALASSSLLAQTAPAPAQSSPFPPATPGKVRIGVIVAGKAPDRSWSLSEAEASALTRRLTEVERKLGNVEFVVGRATNAAETSDLLK
ncbi:MAG TPA: twin-arginine translocation signal domain-containing protein, partial [Verrucomicrobiota bacterium]|nr:twin-arginine translocation signal domain-containing protein [Verrucomicrobiota bacterium]